MPVSATRICHWLAESRRVGRTPLIQTALPELTDGMREVLLSGICESCFDSFAEEPAEL